MINPFHKIDDWIIARFEGAAHTWQRWTGLDCFWLAKQCSIAAMLALSAAALRGLFNLDFDVVAAIPAATTFSMVRLCDWIAARERNRFPRHYANPAKIAPMMRMSRFVWVLLLLISFLLGRSFFGHMFRLHAVLIWITMQFLSCDPLPPCASKIREWLSRAPKKKAQAAEA